MWEAQTNKWTNITNQPSSITVEATAIADSVTRLLKDWSHKNNMAQVQTNVCEKMKACFMLSGAVDWYDELKKHCENRITLRCDKHPT